jgi:hypothetical protein
MLYKGSCHCGAVAFEVEGELTMTVSCNCSICARKGALLWAVPHKDLRLKTPDGAAGRYLFNKHVFAHRFCRSCGIHPYAEDAEAKPDRSAYINVRCLEGVEPNSVPTMAFDGRSI